MAPSPKRPLRIGMLVPYDLAPHAGGVRQHAFHLKRALERGGDQVFLLGPTSAKQPVPAEEADGIFALPGVVTVPVNGTRSAIGMTVSPWALLRLCRRLALDVLHLHEPQVPTMAWGLCWWLKNVPKVATFHAADEQDSIHALRTISGAMVYRFIDRAITVSTASEKRTRQTWRGPLSVIPNGVCTRTFTPGPAGGLSEPGPHLLFVGALGDQRKGARVMLAAFAKAQVHVPSLRLTMVGAQRGFALPELPAGVTLREGLTNEELAACYRQADALVAPAIGRESFGMILLEAMASARPVVASGIAGYREVAHPAGTLFVPPNDAASLAAALVRFAALPASERERMGAVNLAHAERYSWDHVAQALRSEYSKALANDRTPLAPGEWQQVAGVAKSSPVGAAEGPVKAPPKAAARAAVRLPPGATATAARAGRSVATPLPQARPAAL